MSNRCPDCSKWVSLETQDPEINSVDLSDTTIAVDARVSRNCADCGTEMKSNDFSTEMEIPDEWIAAHSHDDAEDNGHGDWEVEEGSSSMSESGGGRYSKNMIGYDLTVTLRCKCGETMDVEIHDEEPASYFNDEV